jgi:glycosyltransferase involved in cell wall biosynthesis
MAAGKRDGESVFVVRNGPNISRIIFREADAKIREGFDFLVGYVGTMNNQDGIENLLGSAKYIVYEKGIRNIKFVLDNVPKNYSDCYLFSLKQFHEYYTQQIHDLLQKFPIDSTTSTGSKILVWS